MSENIENPIEVIVDTPTVVEQPTPIIEQSPVVIETVYETPASENLSVVYSFKATKDLKKGYSKISKDLADQLIKKYSFVRFASQEEISKYL